MFCVYDNGKPAKYPECKVHCSWKNNQFSTLTEAKTYASEWLGGFSPEPDELELNVPYHYVGNDNFLIIREE